MLVLPNVWDEAASRAGVLAASQPARQPGPLPPAIGLTGFPADSCLTPSSIADEADCLVDTNRFSAARAGPLDLLSLRKGAQALGFDAPQVVNHTHAVFCPIALVQAGKVVTREARTAGAGIPAVSASCRATFDLAGDAGLGFAVIVAPATWASIPASQEGVAEAAIHAARGDQVRPTQTPACEFLCHRSGLN
jgi:hypothetical protein